MVKLISFVLASILLAPSAIRAQARANVGGLLGASPSLFEIMNKPEAKYCTNRYRIITRPDGRAAYADIQQSFDYHRLSWAQRVGVTNAMPKWKFLRGEIAQVHEHGLLLTRFSYDLDGNRRYHDSFAVTNYPGFAKLHDAQKIHFFAFE